MDNQFTLTFDGQKLQSLYDVLDMARRTCDVPVAKLALEFMDTIREEAERVNSKAAQAQQEVKNE
jgi:hypothetical protein